MCGRYTVTVDQRKLEKHFGAKFITGHFEPTYNAAPSQMLPIIREHHGHEIELAQWGFWPEGWHSSSKIRPQNNARLETAAEKPMFRKAFAGNHCLVLADSFYEWRTTLNHKQPFRIMLKSGEPFAMAGLFSRDSVDDKKLRFANPR